ncbi:MAG: hypothetical protein A2589_02635 [Candidatus Vogelbacteria bacterium RIFOXYD1_FULL_46_19]|uniref:Uncharacterized protein n=1 Tax=Candidatus Vogelbacteria bacterium RIFOXYD1_FULL_46_19 TaxID=1802439 RepID=A0A1G2QIU5_9BACT|nr:MAG: hypothetical protein A2589_02635 [Candidatus Vogelbacteria bacterium RIFOXYD1_FULL_46_19]
MKSLYIVLARHQVDLDQWLWGAEDSGLLDEEFVLVVPSSPAYADLGVILAGELEPLETACYENILDEEGLMELVRALYAVYRHNETFVVVVVDRDLGLGLFEQLASRLGFPKVIPWVDLKPGKAWSLHREDLAARAQNFP